jgi:hypothetical protein
LTATLAKEMALVDWEAEAIRISLFSHETVNVTDADWREITGQDEAPSRRTVSGRRTLSGSFLAGDFVISAHADRTVCALSPAQPDRDTLEEARIPTLGEWRSTLDNFLKATRDWVAKYPASVTRLGLGVTLLARYPDKESAYKMLLQLLKSVTGDPKRMRDLVFRINWQADSKVLNGLVLNRLTTWSVVELFIRTIAFESETASVTGQTPIIDILRLEMDHNTTQQWKETFGRKDLVYIYTELAGLAVENAERGELP